MTAPVRVVRPLTRQEKIGYFLGFLGIAWVFGTLATEALLHVRHLELPPHWGYASLAAGAIVGWWGFFWAAPKRAREGGTWVMDAADRLHAHRRRTDPPLPPEPLPSPLPPPQPPEP